MIWGDHKTEPGRSLFLSIAEGSFWSVYISVVGIGSALLTGYALALGADDFQIGLLTGMGTIAAVGTLLGARQLGRVTHRKPMMLKALALSRLVWLLPCLLPWLGVAPELCLVALLGVVLVSTTASQFSDTGWMSWMTDLVPSAIRGRYFSWRNSILGAVGMVSVYGAGCACDWLKGRMDPAQAFLPLFVVAVASGIVSLILLARVWEPPMHEEHPLPLQQLLAIPFRHSSFRHLLLVCGLWTLVTGIASPFFPTQMIKHLHMDFSTIGLYAIVAGLSTLAIQPVWGYLIDRFGNKPILMINIIGVTTLPLYWFFARPDFMLPIWINGVMSGIFWPGVMLTTFNLAMAMAPKKNRSAYLASYRLVSGVVACIAALCGGLLAQCLQGFSFDFAGQTLGNYHALFAISCLGRLLVWPLVLGIREERG
jgi:MFS family permease